MGQDQRAIWRSDVGMGPVVPVFRTREVSVESGCRRLTYAREYTDLYAEASACPRPVDSSVFRELSFNEVSISATLSLFLSGRFRFCLI
jgi:hypothetical protein